MWDRVGGLRTLVLGTPGASRDRLNELVLAGRKVATAGLYEIEYVGEDEPVETVGERLVLLDSAEAPIGLVEVTRVETYPFLEVPWEFAAAEGTPIREDDLMVCLWFYLLDEVPPARS